METERLYSITDEGQGVRLKQHAEERRSASYEPDSMTLRRTSLSGAALAEEPQKASFGTSSSVCANGSLRRRDNH